jgi:hypothetical protein
MSGARESLPGGTSSSSEAPRSTPFGLGLPGVAWVEERLGAIAEEARARGSDPSDPGAFLLLAQVGASLGDLRADEASSPELFHSFGLFLFHAFHLFQGDTAPGLLLDVAPAMARYLVEADPAPAGWEGDLPAPAGYLRLPRHLFWTRPGGEEAPAEALDGIAWVRSRTRAGVPHLALLAVTGMVGERSGFSVLPVPPVPLGDARRWLTETARAPEEGPDFGSTLPGGELGRLYSVETAGELLKLVARALALAVVDPGTVRPVPERAEADTAPADGGSGELDARLAHAHLSL